MEYCSVLLESLAGTAPILVHNASHSSMEWVVNTIVTGTAAAAAAVVAFVAAAVAGGVGVAVGVVASSTVVVWAEIAAIASHI